MILFGFAAANTGLPKVLHLPRGGCSRPAAAGPWLLSSPPSPLLQDLPDSAETL